MSKGIVPTKEDYAIRFAILLPLKEMSYTFHVFQLKPIPVWNETLNLGIIKKNKYKFIGVSEDLTMFTLFDELEECAVNK